MTDDLTDNDLVIRQINYSHILGRLLTQRLSGVKPSGFQPQSDFYGDANYWRRQGILMRLVLLCFVVLCLTQKFFIKSLILLTKPLPQIVQKLNIFIQLRRKADQYDQTRKYLSLLLKAESQYGKQKNLIDLHFYKMAMYTEFNSRVTQLVLDTAIGVAIFLAIAAYPDFFINFVDSCCQLMHLEQLEIKIYWLLGNPAGFKPNTNLVNFLGNFILSMISMWNEVTSVLTKVRQFIVFYLAAVGWRGASLQAAAVHDMLFLCSFWLLCVYTMFQQMYWYIISMLSTQMKVFRGRKFNTIRGRDDSNTFHVAEMYLGVIIVAISVFLLPTIGSFYFYAFISIIVSVMILQLLLTFVQIVATDFPYFKLALSLCYPYCLPNGLKFEL